MILETISRFVIAMSQPTPKNTTDIIIYTDGSCLGNPGPGGWATILANLKNSQVVELGGHEDRTTNNQMELRAIIEAVRFLAEALENKSSADLTATVFADSAYVLEGTKKAFWRRTNFPNEQLWLELGDLLQELGDKVEFTWSHVPGHAGIPGNERVNELALSFAEEREPDLYAGPVKDYHFPIAETPKIQVQPKAQKQALYYLSYVDRELQRHSTWAECENRVRGRSLAKYKKITSPEQELEVLKSWGIKSS